MDEPLLVKGEVTLPPLIQCSVDSRCLLGAGASVDTHFLRGLRTAFVESSRPLAACTRSSVARTSSSGGRGRRASTVSADTFGTFARRVTPFPSIATTLSYSCAARRSNGMIPRSPAVSSAVRFAVAVPRSILLTNSGEERGGARLAHACDVVVGNSSTSSCNFGAVAEKHADSPPPGATWWGRVSAHATMVATPGVLRLRRAPARPCPGRDSWPA